MPNMQPVVRMRLCDTNGCNAHAVGKCDFRYCLTKGCNKTFCSECKGGGTCMGRMEDSTCRVCQPRLTKSFINQIWISFLIVFVILGLEFFLFFILQDKDDTYE